ncbi:hypothetical protein EB001_11530 [bacterium]|nr:hypothetical protein [bacterium]
MIKHEQFKAAEQIIANRDQWSKAAVDEALSIILKDYVILRNEIHAIQAWADEIPRPIMPTRYSI